MTASFGEELRKLRGDKSVKEIAHACSVTAETIRQFEAGKRPPSLKLLSTWLSYFGLKITDRKDILESINAKRLETNTRVLEYESTRRLIATSGSVDKDKLTEDLLRLVLEITHADEDTSDYPRYRIRKIIDANID